MPYMDAAEIARRYLLVPRYPQRRRPPTPTRAEKLDGLCKRFRVPLADVLALVPVPPGEENLRVPPAPEAEP